MKAEQFIFMDSKPIKQDEQKMNKPEPTVELL